MKTDGKDLVALIETFDWSRTSLGPKNAWPLHVRSTVSLMLHAKMPMVTLWGPEGIMIYNDAYASFASNRHPGLLGAPVREAWPEAADFNDGILKTVLDGQAISFEDQEFTLLRNGMAEQVWLDLDYSPIMDAEGRPAGVFAIVTETTAKVKAERRLANERDRLHQMFEQAPGFIAVVEGPAHVFVVTNAAYRQLTGHDDIVGRMVREALPELEGQGFFELLDRVYATGEPFIGSSMPVELEPVSGAPAVKRFIDFIFQPIRESDGDISGIFVAGTDITERIAAERALRVSELQFRTFAEAMPNHVWSARPDGQLDWFNDRVYEFSGAARGELDGANWARLVHPEDVAHAAQAWDAAVANGKTYETEFRLRRADGTWRWHLSRAVMLSDEHGPPPGAGLARIRTLRIKSAIVRGCLTASGGSACPSRPLALRRWKLTSPLTGSGPRTVFGSCSACRPGKAGRQQISKHWWLMRITLSPLQPSRARPERQHPTRPTAFGAQTPERSAGSRAIWSSETVLMACPKPCLAHSVM